MSKIEKVNEIDLKKTVMEKINSGKITMKPRWFFVMGSLLTMIGTGGFSIVAIFLTNLMLFGLRQHGPMKEWRLEMIWESFPLWIPVTAITTMTVGIYLLGKYDFSYKRNFGMVAAGFVITIIIAAILLDWSGLNDNWSCQGSMRGFYRQFEKQSSVKNKGQCKKKILE